MPNISSSKAEKNYLRKIKKYPKEVLMAHKDSPTEGFEYFESKEYQQIRGSRKPLILDKFFGNKGKNFFPMVKMFFKHIPMILGGIKKSFLDAESYVAYLEEHEALPKEKSDLKKNYPNEKIWNELQEYARNKWQVVIGFTPLPAQLVFKGKAVLFKFVLVCMQEMNKEEIDKAPALSAGSEVMHVYGTLGMAVNDIASWLREHHGIICQSNHPLGGLTDVSPLAAMAGLGWQGRSGLVITPEFGTRHRIAPIYLEEKLFKFTFTDEHRWVEDFCAVCGKCIKSCPVGAIYQEKKVSIEEIPLIGETKTCIDRKKCFPLFNRTMGCSLCIKVCPFSQGKGVYDRLKQRYENSF